MRGHILVDAIVRYYYGKFKTKEGFEYHFFNFLTENVKFKNQLKNKKNLLNYFWKVYSNLSDEDKKNFLYVFMIYGKKIVDLFENHKFAEAKKLLTTIKVNPEVFRDEVYYFDEENFCFHIYNKRTGRIIGFVINRKRVLELCKYFEITLGGGCYEAKSDNLGDCIGDIDNLI